ncbi:hypothetical protein PFISCL1PPCAC_14440, partial [Pristionchus fissidentatus]
ALEGTLHLKLKHILNTGIHTIPIKNGAFFSWLIDDDRLKRIRYMTPQFSDAANLEGDTIFYATAPTPDEEQLQVFQLTYNFGMYIELINTIDEPSSLLLSGSSSHYILKSGLPEGRIRLFGLDEDYKKTQGREIAIDPVDIGGFVVHNNYIFTMRHNDEGKVVERFDMESGEKQMVWKDDKACCSNFLVDAEGDRLFLFGNRTLVVIDNRALTVTTIETDAPYNPLYRLLAYSDGQLTVSSDRSKPMMWTLQLPEVL